MEPDIEISEVEEKKQLDNAMFEAISQMENEDSIISQKIKEAVSQQIREYIHTKYFKKLKIFLRNNTYFIDNQYILKSLKRTAKIDS